MPHRLTALPVPPSDTPAAEIPLAEAERYLTDESRLRGRAERFFAPRSEGELADVLRAAVAADRTVTLSGARTGITGGAVPTGGWLVSLEKMSRLLGLRYDEAREAFYLRCQPGVPLDAIRQALEARRFPEETQWPEADQAAARRLRASGAWLFPPDPTERSASLGGMVACNASGARTFYYGATRDYVTRLRLLLADGSALDLTRGDVRAAPDGAFELATAGGVGRPGRMPDYAMPRVKNAAGYYSAPGMDLLDLFIGSEGTLGVFSEIEIRLVPAPETILGVIGFFAGEDDAVRFVRAARGETPVGAAPPPHPLALEYFDGHALELLRDQKRRLGAASPIPELPAAAGAAVYSEIPTTEKEMETTAEALLALLDACGCDAGTAWTALTADETEKLKAFRHALPETVNLRIGERARLHPGLTKLGTDFAVPDAGLAPMLAAYRATLDAAGLEYVLFGHIGNNHVHVNILPRDLDEYARGKTLYLELARRALALGGTVSGEHGIGKLKKPLLALMYGERGVAAMRAVKAVFDPGGRLNPGTLFA